MLDRRTVPQTKALRDDTVKARLSL